MRRLPRPLSVAELLLRAQALEGQTVGALADALGHALPTRPAAAKGVVGQLVEAALGADADAGERPDFVALKVELKTVPVQPVRAQGQAHVLVPKESTFVCSISLPIAPTETFATSRLARRLATVLLVPVLAARLAPLAARTFFAPRLWVPTAAEWATLEADWEDLVGAIDAGRGGSLTAREGQALQVRPKAAHSRVRTLGPSADGRGADLVLPQGFYLRARFLAEVLAASPA